MHRTVRAFSLAAIAVTALAAAACSDNGSSASQTVAEAGTLKVDIKPTDMILGKEDAPVLMVEYASMTCPHCARVAANTMPEVKKEYIDTGKVRYVFREFPLDGGARLAASLARCMSGDNYFSFVDLLFANQAKWILDAEGKPRGTQEAVVDGLAEVARFAGMSREKAESCINDPANLAIVDENWKEAQSKYNVNSTPTFIINGTSHSGELSFQQIKDIVDPLLK